MSESADTSGGRRRAKIRWRWLLLTVALGIVPIAISFIYGQWWVGTVFLLLTSFLACFCLPRDMYVTFFTGWGFFAVAWISGSVLNSLLASRADISYESGLLLSILGGITLGVVVCFLFWLAALFVTTKWILNITGSFDVPFREAFRFVASQTFDTSQAYQIVENGQVIVDSPKGFLSRFGGPGVLVVRPGNAVVLERGGRTTRIVGPGLHRLRRFEGIKTPAPIKGIVDLSPQFGVATAENVRTADGIPLKFVIGHGWQIESQAETDARLRATPSNPEMIGDPEYPVYEETIRNAVFRTPPEGWHGLFPIGPINILRDVVSTYTFDQLFATPQGSPGPPAVPNRVIRQIEQAVDTQFRSVWAGVTYRGLDIREVDPPEDIGQQMIQRRARIETSEAEAAALTKMEEARLTARGNMAVAIQGWISKMGSVPPAIQLAYIDAVQQITDRVGQDKDIAMRYIEALQAIIASDGEKSFTLMSPTGVPTMGMPGLGGMFPGGGGPLRGGGSVPPPAGGASPSGGGGTPATPGSDGGTPSGESSTPSTPGSGGGAPSGGGGTPATPAGTPPPSGGSGGTSPNPGDGSTGTTP